MNDLLKCNLLWSFISICLTKKTLNIVTYRPLENDINISVLPVVMMADLIADGDHEGWTALTKVAIPVT